MVRLIRLKKLVSAISRVIADNCFSSKCSAAAYVEAAPGVTRARLRRPNDAWRVADQAAAV
jgi:hypothetical protein